MFRRGARVRPVRTAGVSAALALALGDPLRNALAGARLKEVGHAGNAAQEFLLAGDEHRPEGLLWNGVNVSPLSATAQALDDFGRYLAPRTRRASSVVGDRGAVEALWQHLAMRWGAEVREYRWSQPQIGRASCRESVQIPVTAESRIQP